jgi:hypothetical protein
MRLSRVLRTHFRLRKASVNAEKEYIYYFSEFTKGFLSLECVLSNLESLILESLDSRRDIAQNDDELRCNAIEKRVDPDPGQTQN